MWLPRLWTLASPDPKTCSAFRNCGERNMIKAILKTMFGLAVVVVGLAALVYPPLLFGILLIYLAYSVGKWTFG